MLRDRLPNFVNRNETLPRARRDLDTGRDRFRPGNHVCILRYGSGRAPPPRLFVSPKFAQSGHPRRAPSRVGQNLTTIAQTLPYTFKPHLQPLDDQCSRLRCRSESDGARPSSGRGRCGANFDAQACVCGQNAYHTCRNLVQHFRLAFGLGAPWRPYPLSIRRFRLSARGAPRYRRCCAGALYQ